MLTIKNLMDADQYNELIEQYRFTLTDKYDFELSSQEWIEATDKAINMALTVDIDEARLDVLTYGLTLNE